MTSAKYPRCHQVGDGIPRFSKPSIYDGHLCGCRDQVRARSVLVGVALTCLRRWVSPKHIIPDLVGRLHVWVQVDLLYAVYDLDLPRLYHSNAVVSIGWVFDPLLGR